LEPPKAQAELIPMADNKNDWEDSKLIARAILHGRTSRRKTIGSILLFALLWIATGLWIIDEWLASKPVWFFLWWAASAVITLVVMLFALYDALAVIREERNRHR
jgi:hypothetical protein